MNNKANIFSCKIEKKYIKEQPVFTPYVNMIDRNSISHPHPTFSGRVEYIEKVRIVSTGNESTKYTSQLKS